MKRLWTDDRGRARARSVLHTKARCRARKTFLSSFPRKSRVRTHNNNNNNIIRRCYMWRTNGACPPPRIIFYAGVPNRAYRRSHSDTVSCWVSGIIRVWRWLCYRWRTYRLVRTTHEILSFSPFLPFVRALYCPRYLLLLLRLILRLTQYL